ncbi:MAG: sulfotransferase domain-containing protein [Acidimicrobiales bacterium]
MSARERATATFLRLPASVQQRTLHALGKFAPWEAGFDHRAPVVGAELGTGPPDFVGVGVQKAGTTWWYSLINQHPGVYHHDGFHKERHFFGRFCVAEFSPEDAREYQRWFPRPPGRLTGEWTPDYIHQHWVPPMLASSAPSAKLLVLLRDPVARFRSGLDHHRERGETLTPLLVSDAFARGLYGEQLARLESVFPRQQVLVLQYEACAKETARFLAKTFRFLGLDDSFVPPGAHESVNRTKVTPLRLADRTRDQLTELYQDDLRRLAAAHPELELDRWPSFATGAGLTQPR